VDEALACLAAITAPTLSVEASDDSLGQWHQGRYTLEQYHERIATSRNARSPACRTQAICCTTTSRRPWPA
jgi:hypothetical protein